MKASVVLSAGLLALAVAPATSQERAGAEVVCVPAGDALAYDCEARIFDMATDEAIDDLTVAVKADMSSMPMAHNIPPVAAEPTEQPGVYAFSLTLDMHGAWAFSLRVSGAREDLIVEVLDFQADAQRVISSEEAGADAANGDRHEHGH